MMTDARLLRLFSTPVIVHEVEAASEINDPLKRAILKRREEHDGLSLSNRGAGWQSDRQFSVWAGQPGKKLIQIATSLASDHTARAGGAPVSWRVDAWANASESGGFNMSHVHGGSFWSAVYYVAIGDGSGGQLVLHDPRMPALRMHAPGLRFKDFGPDVRATIEPREGLIVLFPAWLSHSVEPWEGAGTRISVAMNIRWSGQ